MNDDAFEKPGFEPKPYEPSADEQHDAQPTFGQRPPQPEAPDFSQPYTPSEPQTFGHQGVTPEAPMPPAAPSFGEQAPSFGEQPAPSFGQAAPSFGQQSPSFGQQAPSFGEQAPSFGQAPASGYTPEAPMPPASALPFGQAAQSFGQAPAGNTSESPLVDRAETLIKKQPEEKSAKRKIKPLWILTALGAMLVIGLVVVFTLSAAPEAPVYDEAPVPISTDDTPVSTPIEPVAEGDLFAPDSETPAPAVEAEAPVSEEVAPATDNSAREKACGDHFDGFYRENNLNPADYPNEKAEYMAKCLDAAQ